MKRLLVAALAVITLAGCNDVNGVKSDRFIRDCYSKGGVPIVTKRGEMSVHEGQFCIKKEAVLGYNEDY
ncbi:hypothetical protein VPHD148_0087 [Vibrio phage D148]